jgi:hypothetical protein
MLHDATTCGSMSCCLMVLKLPLTLLLKLVFLQHVQICVVATPYCPRITAAKDLGRLDGNATGAVALAVSRAR